MGIFDSFRKAKEAEAKASAGTNEFSNEFSNEVSNEANEAEASGSKAAALGNPELETLPKVLVRPQSDENGSLMAWEGVKKLRCLTVEIMGGERFLVDFFVHFLSFLVFF